MHAPHTRWPSALAPLWVLAVGAWLWRFTVDDAFIVGRYAQNLASGRGYAMNPGPPTDGVTGPLWLLPGTLGAALGGDPVRAAKLMGLAAGASAVALTCRRAGALGATPWVVALALALPPDSAVWSSAGLGSGLAMLLVVGALRAALAPEPAARVLGTCVGLLAWLRPECAALGASLLITGSLRSRDAGARAWGFAGALVVALLAFRLALFGHALPLSVHAKAGGLGVGAPYALRGALWTTGGVGLALAVWAAWMGGVRARTLAAGWFSHLASVALVGGDWMPGFRLLLPALPLYAGLLGVAHARLASRRPALAHGLVALALCAPTLDLALRAPAIHARVPVDEGPTAALAQWLRGHAQQVALVDVGYLAYASGVEVVDLGAVTDPVLARLPGGHLDKRVPQDLLRRRDPDTLVLHARTPPRVDPDGRLQTLDGYPVERRVASFPWVQREFRVAQVVRHAPHYHYVVLTRRSSRAQ